MTRILIACVTAIVLMAQPVMAQTDAKAKAVLDNVSSTFKKLKSLKADFKMDILAGNVKDTKKGTFYLKGDKYRIEMSNMHIMTDTKNQYTYNKEIGEVQITEYIADEQEISPKKIFGGDYEKQYKSRYDGTKTVNGKSCETITMVAKNGSADMKQVKLYIDKKSNIIVRSEMISKEGSNITYDISNLKTDLPLKDNLFTFDTKAEENKNIDVVDLR